MIVDTTFLIDLQREAIRGARGPAAAFLERNRSAVLKASAVTVGEFLGGYATGREPEGRELFDAFEVLPIERATAIRYAALSRSLRTQGVRMGDNDVWIASTALEAAEPLVTRDIEHFSRIPGLDVLGYQSE